MTTCLDSTEPKRLLDTIMATSGFSSAARRTFNAAVARISPSHAQPSASAAHSAKIPFRPRSQQQTAVAAFNPSTEGSSITGLKFCLHMVAFAVPGVILAKKMCDGEQLEDMVKSTQDTITACVNSLA
ncbi:hypothetical protein EDD11_002899 [Mortierella claussenii]|nr:hypothetical protein EDD11_002899 [Mortierella claussenii]